MAFAHDFRGRGAQLVERIRALHAINVAGIEQAAHVFAQAKCGRALIGVVTADPLEYRRPVTDDVRENVNLRVLPGNQLSVMPDFLGLLDAHEGSPWRNYSIPTKRPVRSLLGTFGPEIACFLKNSSG